MLRLSNLLLLLQLVICPMSIGSAIDDLLENQVVLITGASGDIGADIARETLEKTKARLILHFNNNKGKLDALIMKYGDDRVKTLQADFLHPELMKQFFNQALSWQGKIDIVINSAGYEKVAESLDQVHDVTMVTFKINYFSPRMVCEYALNHFHGSKTPGMIINLGSRAAYRGMPAGLYHYADSKAALLRYTQQIARDNAEAGICLYTIAPGPVRDACIESMATKKVVSVQETTNIALFLMQRKIPNGIGGTIDLMGASWFH